LALLYSTSTIKFFDFSQHFTGHQWFWDYSSLVPFTSEYNNMLFLSSDKYSSHFLKNLDLDNVNVLDYFYNAADPLFRFPDLSRIMNPENFFNWQAFKDSKVQAAFRWSVIFFFNDDFAFRKSEQYNAGDALRETNRTWVNFVDFLDFYFYKTGYNFDFLTDKSHVDHWDDFLRFVHYCYHFDLFGFRHFLSDIIPHFTIMLILLMKFLIFLVL
jgi:hypothetical protein